jgi:hypothetical protein
LNESEKGIYLEKGYAYGVPEKPVTHDEPFGLEEPVIDLNSARKRGRPKLV